MRKAMDKAGWGCTAKNSSTATTIAAIEAFMSAAPRPYSLPARCVGVKGWLCHCSSGPVGTTSVWPAKTSVLTGASENSEFAIGSIAAGAGADCARGLKPSNFAHKLVTRKFCGPLTMVSHLKPKGASRAIKMAWQFASSGVMEGREISCSASRSVRDIVIEVAAAGAGS